MGLRGQERRAERGYAMAALLVTIAIMAVLMSAALPVWRQQAQREKEEELVWRGLQYVRAIRLYQARTQALPPSVDVLVQGRFLRKKYKDPITNDDFQILGASSPMPGQQEQRLPGQPSQAMQSAQPVVGGIIGVVSKSKAESIRLYQGHSHYNEWTFLFVNQAPGRGGFPGMRGRQGAPGRQGGPGRRGGPGEGGFPGRGGFPGGRGAFPGMRGVGPGGQPPMSPGRRGGG